MLNNLKTTELKSPYPYFGGKSYVAELVWERFGKTDTYLEPFFGSGAVLLGNPNWQHCTETVNDLDHYIANAWRAIQAAPDETARWADYPVVETDLHARHCWLVTEGRERIAKCASDPDFYDAKVAGWWLWGISCWIGSGWCRGDGWWNAERLALAEQLGTYDRAEILRQLPQLSNKESGVKRKLPHLRNNGQGVSRQLPHLVTERKGVNRIAIERYDTLDGIYPVNAGLREYFGRLARRLRRVRVCCGDWERICVPAVHWAGECAPLPAVAGVFLDPPYSADAGRTARLYAHDCEQVALRVLDWCKRNGHNPQMRIALCGYAGEKHEELEKLGWSVVEWKSPSGMSAFAESDFSKTNRARERIWFSPHCECDRQGLLL